MALVLQCYSSLVYVDRFHHDMSLVNREPAQEIYVVNLQRRYTVSVLDRRCQTGSRNKIKFFTPGTGATQA